MTYKGAVSLAAKRKIYHRHQIKEELRLRLTEVFDRYKGRTMDSRTLDTIKAGAVAVIEEMRANGELPPKTPLGTYLAADRDVVNITLSLYLRLWLEFGEAALVIRFHNDCDRCVFLAASDSHDFYYCPRENIMGTETVIARYGNEAPEYQSGILIAKKLSQDKQDDPLAMAYRLAVEMEYIE